MNCFTREAEKKQKLDELQEKIEPVKDAMSNCSSKLQDVKEPGSPEDNYEVRKQQRALEVRPLLTAPGISRYTRNSINQSINPSIHPSIHPSINQSVNQSVSQSINQSINQSIIQSINQSVSQSVNQSISQSVS